MRLIAWLLAVIMMTAAAAQVCASQDVAGAGAAASDDAPDVVMSAIPEPVAVARPEHRPIVQIEAPPERSLGRVHAVLIFRPPR